MAKSKARWKKQCAEHLIAFEGGRFKYQELNPYWSKCCRAEFTTKKGLLKHTTSGKHQFPSRNMPDTAVIIVSGADEMMRVGSRPNRSKNYGNKDVIDVSGVGISEGNDWFSPGWALKPNRVTGKMNEELRGELIKMSNDGETTGGTKKKKRQKYIALEARKELSKIKLSSGLIKFSRTSTYGNLLTPGQITSFLSHLKAKNTTMNAKQTIAAYKLEDIPKGRVSPY